MKRRRLSRTLWRLWVPLGSLFLLGGCGLSDSQLTSIAQSVIISGLNSFLTQLISSVLGTAGTTGA